jgi:uncharacterized protein
VADVTITRELTDTKGRYLGRVPALDEAAELTMSRASATLFIADHTFVPDSMRGTGVGRRLVDRLIADARSEGFKIIPLCPFVKSQYVRHPEWSDVMQG